MICGEAAELLGREVAARDLDLDGREALLALRLDVGARRSARTRVRSPFGLAVARAAAAGALASSSWTNSSGVRVEVALGDPVALELLLDLVAQLVDAELVDEHLDAGAGAVDAQPVLAVEDAQDGLGDLQVLAVVGARRSRRASARRAA